MSQHHAPPETLGGMTDRQLELLWALTEYGMSRLEDPQDPDVLGIPTTYQELGEAQHPIEAEFKRRGKEPPVF